MDVSPKLKIAATKSDPRTPCQKLSVPPDSPMISFHFLVLSSGSIVVMLLSQEDLIVRRIHHPLRQKSRFLLSCLFLNAS
jgi:hypothetical protein